MRQERAEDQQGLSELETPRTIGAEAHWELEVTQRIGEDKGYKTMFYILEQLSVVTSRLH